MGNSSVLLIYTGGTIGMKTDPASGVLAPFDFNDIYEEFPSLRMLGVNVDVVPFEPIDSSNASPALWVRLAEIIKENYDKYEGFVVLHGTDTMSYTSSALSFMLENLSKPVVFTGSQIPIGVLRTDGRENLMTAIEIAAARNNGEAIVPEVSLYFQNRLFRGNRTIKQSAEELSAFASFNYPPLADVGVGISYHKDNILRSNPERGFSLNTDISGDISIIKIFPGMREDIFRAMLNAPYVKGIVLETYGAGNAPTYGWFIDALREVVSRGVCVLNVTQCASGAVNMDIYETGRRLSEAGVTGGGDMTTEAAATKMMHLIGMGYGPDKVRELLQVSLRGEMTVQ